MSEKIDNQAGPIVLLVVDGWGISPSWQGNAIAQAQPKVMTRLWREYAHTILHTSQPLFQSKRFQIGSSDIGHAMLGSGRLIHSDLEEILSTIESGLFAKNPSLIEALQTSQSKKRPVHLIGLASDGAIHSDLRILEELLKLSQTNQVPAVYLHLITDGRDTPNQSGLRYLGQINDLCRRYQIGTVVSLVGRHYAMDRDNHWDRTLNAYRLWTEGVGQKATNSTTALTGAYAQTVTDEMLPPTWVGQSPDGVIADDDLVIFFNTRADRLRQMVQAFIDPQALSKTIGRAAPLKKLSRCLTLVSPHLSGRLPFETAFPPAQLSTTLTEILAGRGYRQLRVAESEKYPHISFYLNGGREAAYPGEDRLIIPSPRTDDYRSRPGSATVELTKQLLKTIQSKQYDFVVANIGNVDLVGHTGDLPTATKAVTIADQAIGEIAQAVLALNGKVLITADHGNVEQMIARGGRQWQASHTVNPVPFVLVAPEFHQDLLKQAFVTEPLLADLFGSRRTLADVAPTILDLFGIPIPVEMTGTSLLSQLQ